MTSLRVAILELPATYGAPARALAGVEARLAGGPPTDLVVLPEASLTGYVSPDGDFDLARFAEPIDGPVATACAALAARRAVHLVAPLVLAEAGARYNAMACWGPRGDLVFVYRKRHPWMPETWATPGPHPPPVVAIGGVTVTIAICYDHHFLHECPDALAAADLLLFPSAWVEQIDRRAERLIETAREENLAIANANWAPGVVAISGQGGSCAIDPTGRVIATAPLAGRIDFAV